MIDVILLKKKRTLYKMHISQKLQNEPIESLYNIHV